MPIANHSDHKPPISFAFNHYLSAYSFHTNMSDNKFNQNNINARFIINRINNKYLSRGKTISSILYQECYQYYYISPYYYSYALSDSQRNTLIFARNTTNAYNFTYTHIGEMKNTMSLRRQKPRTSFYGLLKVRK